VIFRGIERRRIFMDDDDRQELLDRLSSVLPESDMGCYAWALMPNHVHLVLRTGAIPLARVMARINTGYACAFNRRHDRVGHLFQNRYRSILVDDDAHLFALVRYVHLNPLRAGLVPSLAALERYSWTGYATLLGHRVTPFQDTQAVLASGGDSVEVARRLLRDSMAAQLESAPPTHQEGESGATNEGRSEPVKIESVCDFSAARTPSAAPPSFQALLDRVCEERNVLGSELLRGSRSRSATRARMEVAYRACFELGLSAAEVAKALGVTRGAVCQALQRARESGLGPIHLTPPRG
jgi:REP element-mobilizing transposase RayT